MIAKDAVRFRAANGRREVERPAPTDGSVDLDSGVARRPSARSKLTPAASQLYEPLDFVMVRAPALPVEAYLGLSGAQRGDSPPGDGVTVRPEDPLIVRAITVASSALGAEMRRLPNHRQLSASARGALLRYVIRMSTRPTPFGLFAGAALGQWGERTDLSLSASVGKTRTRPDMAWLLGLVMDLEARPMVRQHLRLVANSSAVIRAGRVWLGERAPMQGGGGGSAVSLRATPVVLRALALAHEPIAYRDLAAALLASTEAATPHKIDTLLTQLWEHTLLLTDLRPPLTAADPARYVADRLKDIPQAEAVLESLQSVLEAVAAWDALPPEQGAAAFPRLVAKALAVTGPVTDTPLMVDTALALRGQRIHRAVGMEAARAAELLLRLTPLPAGPPHITAYRRAFEAKYGHDREVPLLEVLDPDCGLGPPNGHGAVSEIPPARSARRARTLLRLAVSALRDRRRVVDLDADTLSRIGTWSPSLATAPPSLDIYAFVAARSAAALDAGDFQVIVGPNLGASAAGRNLGRFADLLGAAPPALRRAAQAEQERVPRHVWAELVYLPRRFRSANVIVRPPVRSHEIVLGTSAGVSPSKVIPLDQLVVGTRAGRFYVRWPAEAVEVVVCAGHMLNTGGAPSVVRFLSDVNRDGQPQLSSFDWGPASDFPFLPRVRVGRIVLSPAEWRIDSWCGPQQLSSDSPRTFRSAVEHWRATWQVPRHVALTTGDNRLLLDLEDKAQLEELRAVVRGSREGGSIVLQEVLPDLDQLWLAGPGGHYVSELVVSLVRRADGEQVEPDRRLGATPSPVVASTAPSPHGTASERLRPPGSEWLFAKLYCPRALEEDVLNGAMLDFVEEEMAAGLASEWFFLRYADPDPHIRLRLRGEPATLTTRLLPRLCAWASDLMAEERCSRFSLDTYEREIERYGGPPAMDAAEALFAADSLAVCRLLRLLQGSALGMDRVELAVLTVDDLLGGLGLDAASRAQWCREGLTNRHESGSEYRQRKVRLRSLLSRRSEPSGAVTGDVTGDMPGSETIWTILEARRSVAAEVAGRLRHLENVGQLAHRPDALYRSYVHLHLNRLLPYGSNLEQRVLGLLLRTREGLARTQVPAGIEDS
jgi:thiopeptide-type bacteriocin biosynthesis protein